MKKALRGVVAAVLAWQAKRLQRKNSFQTIGVVGSIGKTSTKLAIAQTLGATKKVQYQNGNYNDYVSVPLVLFGQNMPSLLNPFAWLRVFYQNERILARAYPYELVVLELGTDGPGQIAAFKKYLQLDLAVVTAVTPEHMEYFEDIDAVAREELSVANFADKVLVNKDLVDDKHQELVNDAITYSLTSSADYAAHDPQYTSEGISMQITKHKNSFTSVRLNGFSEAQAYSGLAAVAAADLLNIPVDAIKEGLTKIEAVSGRMQKLQGIKNVTIIDDSYNASPVAVKSALDMLYRIEAPQKIALLGSMNELGDFSKSAHTEIGQYCDPERLDIVITLGPDANEFTAPAAQKQGCNVASFTSPYDAGEFIKQQIKDGALILIKGSQNKVFAEEAIKSLLRDPADAQKLVRQSPDWLKLKAKQFGK